MTISHRVGFVEFAKPWANTYWLTWRHQMSACAVMSDLAFVNIPLGDLLMLPTHNTLSENIRAQSVELLNKHLAAAIDLHAQVKQAHWNVRGPSFIAIHELFDKVSSEVENYSDLIAERAGGLGGRHMAPSKWRLSARFSSPIRSASRTSRNTYLPFRERSPHLANPHERPSIRRQPLEMRISPICSLKSRGGIDHQLWFVESHIVRKK